MVEPLAVPPNALLGGAQGPEALRRAGDHVDKELHHDSDGGDASDRDVEENPRSRSHLWPKRLGFPRFLPPCHSLRHSWDPGWGVCAAYMAEM